MPLIPGLPWRPKLLPAALSLTLLALLGGGLFLNGYSLPPAWAQTTADYDSDDDGLIEISNLAQLNAIRWDLDGDGAVDETANQTSYTAAFANAAAGMGCPDSAADADTNPDPCAGYELHGDLTFDSNGDGSVTAADSGGLYWNGGKGWTPIGDPGNPYRGELQGRGKVISHLFISRDAADTADAVGLFGAVGKDGSVTGLGLAQVSITSNQQSAVGSIAGVNQGTITSSYATGTVTGSAVTGGLVGLNLFGTVQASFAATTVSLALGDAVAGGLVGQNLLGEIKASYASGAVSANAIKSLAGGLVGINQGTITASYARGRVSVSGQGSVKGGLAAYDLGTETYSYWDTETTGIAGSGGLGQPTSHLQTPTGYSGLYANWNLDLDGVEGGDNPWDFGNSRHYPILVYGDIKSAPQQRDYDTDNDRRIEITTLEQLNALRWDLNTDGVVAAADQVSYEAAFPGLTAGMGCADGATAAVCIGYELEVDLDFDTDGDDDVDGNDGFHWNTGRGWFSIGSATAPFTGQFYGNDKSIHNLFVNQNETGQAGLFGQVGSGGVIDGVKLREVNIASLDGTAVGALAGVNGGTIKGSSATGRIRADETVGTVYAGGLVGSNTNSIASSYAKTEVDGSASAAGGLAGHNGTAGSIVASYSDFAPILTSRNNAYLGGLVGHNQGSITAAYSFSPVKATGNTASVGGLVGYNQRTDSTVTTQGTITAAYAIGPVVATGTTPAAGGLVGKNSGGTATDSYWETRVSGQSSSALGTGKTQSELFAPAGYSGIYANWNLNLDGQAGNDDPWDFRRHYPKLKYGGVDFAEQLHLHLTLEGGDYLIVGEATITGFGVRPWLTRAGGRIVWEVSDDGVTGWTPFVSRAPRRGVERIGGYGIFGIVPDPSEVGKRVRFAMNSRERGLIYSPPTPPVKASWTGATAAISFVSGHNPPRVGQEITISGGNEVKWIHCNDTAGNGCTIGGDTPGERGQGKYVYAYRYYTDRNGVLTKASTPFIGPVQAAASP